MIEINIDNIIQPFKISDIHCYKEENNKTRIWVKGNKTYIVDESFEDFKNKLKIEIKNRNHNKYIHEIKKF
jgi:adenosine deaminase